MRATLRDRRLLILAAVPAVLWIGLLLASDKTFWSLVYDDSFYYWQIGSNLAAGHGSTFDGLHPTNGYHPLWMAFCAGLYALGLGRDTAPMVAMVVQVLVFAAAWLLLGGAVVRVLREVRTTSTRRLEYWPLGLLLLIACVQPMVKVWVNGLESTFVLLSQVLLLGVLLRTDDLLAPSARRTRLACAGLITLSFLSRTDGALLMPAIGLWLLPRLVRRFRETVVQALELLVIPATVTVVYMVANQVWFGSAIQVSGQMKTPDLTVWRLLGALAVVALPVLAVRRLNRTRWPRLTLALGRTGCFGLFALFLAAYYGVLQIFPRLWYSGPVLLYVVLLGCLAIADLVDSAEAAPGSATPRTKILAGVLAVVAALPVVDGIRQAITAPGAAPMLTARTAGVYIATQLPQDAVLSSWDAGVLGYYSDRSVVNLDGVVNTAGYLAALRSGTTAEYLAEVPIGWVVNHTTDEAELRATAIDTLGERADGATVVQSWPFDVFAGSNQFWPEAHSYTIYLLQLRPRP